MKRVKKLERQFRKHLGNKNAEEVVKQISQNLRLEQKIDPESKSILVLEKFSDFIDIVEKSYLDYDDRLNLATRNIEISSRELTTAFVDLEDLNTNINAMLDSLGQGLLFFDKEGICSPVFSKSCYEILGCNPSEQAIPKVLGFSEEQEKVFYSWLRIVLNADIALSFDDMKSLLPNEIKRDNGLIIELDYKPMYIVEEKLSGILLIATDVTYKKIAEEKLEETQRTAKKIQEIAQNRNGFNRFIKEVSDFITNHQNISENITPENLDDFLRGLHTHKALAAVFSLTKLAQEIHVLEGKVRKEYNREEIRKSLDEIGQIIVNEKEFIKNIFGSEFVTKGDVKTIEIDDLGKLINLINDYVAEADAKNIIKDFINKKIIAVPIFEAFTSFEREINRLSSEQGKPKPRYQVIGSNFPILFSEYEEFFNSLIHLARNIVDHGIENASDRISKGKSDADEVIIETMLLNQDTSINIRISDDGNGINPEIVKSRLLNNGECSVSLSNESDEEIIQHIFDPGFSSKDTRTLVSGLGIGMSAIKNIVEKMGGEVFVYSDFANKKGTVFNFSLPYKI